MKVEEILLKLVETNAEPTANQTHRSLGFETSGKPRHRMHS